MKKIFFAITAINTSFCMQYQSPKQSLRNSREYTNVDLSENGLKEQIKSLILHQQYDDILQILNLRDAKNLTQQDLEELKTFVNDKQVINKKHCSTFKKLSWTCAILISAILATGGSLYLYGNLQNDEGIMQAAYYILETGGTLGFSSCLGLNVFQITRSNCESLKKQIRIESQQNKQQDVLEKLSELSKNLN
ncbi:hypothetical protein M1446_04110 [Candidatus Dependentiae bacterium]|nr:hypothetical protein [Candidatus Dependentiae bacterium]